MSQPYRKYVSVTKETYDRCLEHREITGIPISALAESVINDFLDSENYNPLPTASATVGFEGALWEVKRTSPEEGKSFALSMRSITAELVVGKKGVGRRVHIIMDYENI